jgi:hypothetical protein
MPASMLYPVGDLQGASLDASNSACAIEKDRSQSRVAAERYTCNFECDRHLVRMPDISLAAGHRLVSRNDYGARIPFLSKGRH